MESDLFYVFGVLLSADFLTAIKFQHVPHQKKFELDNKKRIPLLVYTINVLLDYHLIWLYSECLTNARISLYRSDEAFHGLLNLKLPILDMISIVCLQFDDSNIKPTLILNVKVIRTTKRLI